MKKRRSTDKAAEAAGPIQKLAPRRENDNKLPSDSDLSPNRVLDGALTTTALLHELLAQQQAPHQLRDWGINE